MHFSAVGTPSIVGSANGAANEPAAHSLAVPVHGFGPSRPPSSCARAGATTHATSVARARTIRMDAPPLRAAGARCDPAPAYRRPETAHAPESGKPADGRGEKSRPERQAYTWRWARRRAKRGRTPPVMWIVR